MKQLINCSLEGSYKVDLYSGGKLVTKGEWMSNFITQTGLFYPMIYPFVDCFRFLSIGSSAQGNVAGILSGASTTGLYAPIVTFGVNGGNGVFQESGQWIGYPGYAIGNGVNVQSSCGTILAPQGPRFFRAWNLPTGADNGEVVDQEAGFLTINEFAVSPSSGTDPVGACAFSRINRTVVIPNGQSSIISYQLAINIENTGLTFFNSGTFTTGNANITNSNDATLVSSWGNLSGYYRQVFHGLQVIDANGAHSLLNEGAGMEPSLNSFAGYSFYLSPDNSQFDTNNTTGMQTVDYNSYLADGLLQTIQGVDSTPTQPNPVPQPADSYYYTPVTNSSNDNTNASYPANTRIGQGTTAFQFPPLYNYTITDNFNNENYLTFIQASQLPISYATPGINGLSSSDINLGQKAIFSSRISLLPFDPTRNNYQNATGRIKTVTRKTVFPPISAPGYNTRFGSLTYAYLNNYSSSSLASTTFYPMVDTAFFDSSNRSLMQHYRIITGVVLTERGSGISNAVFFLTPTGQNSARFNSCLSTFQGPYTGINASGIDTNSPALSSVVNPANYPLSPYTSWLWNSNGQSTNGTVSGLLFDGILQTGSFGNSQVSINGGIGWGSVYGLAGNLNTFAQFYDCGLTNHNITGGTGGLFITPPPNNTGTIYWPSTVNGSPVLLNITGVTFYSPEFGTITDSGWFGPTHQIVEKVTFTDYNNSCSPAGLLNNGTTQQMITNPTGFTNQISLPIENPINPNTPSEYGYFLTTVRYNYAPVTNTDEVHFITSPTIFTVSGYVDSGIVASCSYNSTSLTGSGTLFANVNTSIVNITNNVNNFNLSNAITITGFFANLSQRGYSGSLRNPILPRQPSLEFYISGKSGASPLYLTYLQLSGDGSTNIAHSYLNPTVHSTSFMRPTGYLVHAEYINNPNQLFQTVGAAITVTGYRLLPNYAIPNNMGVNIYQPQTGGFLPGLSYNNTLNLFQDIQWSSPCDPEDQSCIPNY